MCEAAVSHADYLYSHSWEYSKRLRDSMKDVDLSELRWPNASHFMAVLRDDIDTDCEYLDTRVEKLFGTLQVKDSTAYEAAVDSLHCLIAAKTMKIYAYKERYLAYLIAQKTYDVEHQLLALEKTLSAMELAKH